MPSNDASTEEQTYLLHRGSTYILVVGMERVIVCMLLENWRSEVMGAAASLDTMRVESAHTLMTEMKAKGLLDGIEQRCVGVDGLFLLTISLGCAHLLHFQVWSWLILPWQQCSVHDIIGAVR